MPICRLCQKREANQTGSHLFTYALIKTAINEDGEKSRDKELTFGISNQESPSLFFGRATSPEKVNKVLGHDVTDKEIEENINPFTRDYIFCRICEKRFTSVENYFNDNIYTFLNNNGEFPTDKRHGSHIKFDEQGSLLVRLYFYIQIFRAKAGEYHNFKLKANVQNKLRRIINKTIDVSLERTIHNANEHRHSIIQFPMSVTYGAIEADAESLHKYSENVVYVDEYKKPYYLILNNFFIKFYSNKKYNTRHQKFLFGLTDALKDRVHINYKEKKFVVNRISDAERKTILSWLFNRISQLFVKNFVRQFSYDYFFKNGQFPTKEIVRKALDGEMFNLEK